MTDQISPYFRKISAPHPDQELQWRADKLLPSMRRDFEKLKEKQRESLNQVKSQNERNRSERIRNKALEILQRMSAPHLRPKNVVESYREKQDRAQKLAEHTISSQEASQERALNRLFDKRKREFVEKAELSMAKKKMPLAKRHFNKAARDNFTR